MLRSSSCCILSEHSFTTASNTARCNSRRKDRAGRNYNSASGGCNDATPAFTTPPPAAATTPPPIPMTAPAGNVNPPTPENKTNASSPTAAPSYGFWVTYAAMGFVLLTLTLMIIRGTRDWSLKEALSEDVGNAVFKASISRFIALLGFAVIISIYLGTGSSVIYRILGGGTVGDLTGLGTLSSRPISPTNSKEP
jgi:hypothetical protein